MCSEVLRARLSVLMSVRSRRLCLGKRFNLVDCRGFRSGRSGRRRLQVNSSSGRSLPPSNGINLTLKSVVLAIHSMASILRSATREQRVKVW